MADTRDPATSDGRCWCCDGAFGATEMVHLGSHPEVTVCRGCARYLNRRASAELGSPSPVRLVRRGTLALRDRAVALELHERRVVGPALRWLDDRLP